jgi:hypothetical protein
MSDPLWGHASLKYEKRRNALAPRSFELLASVRASSLGLRLDRFLEVLGVNACSSLPAPRKSFYIGILTRAANPASKIQGFAPASSGLRIFL